MKNSKSHLASYFYQRTFDIKISIQTSDSIQRVKFKSEPSIMSIAIADC